MRKEYLYRKHVSPLTAASLPVTDTDPSPLRNKPTDGTLTVGDASSTDSAVGDTDALSPPTLPTPDTVVVSTDASNIERSILRRLVPSTPG
jgi:hypothetical protein